MNYLEAELSRYRVGTGNIFEAKLRGTNPNEIRQLTIYYLNADIGNS